MEKPLSCRMCPAIKIKRKEIICPINKTLNKVENARDELILWKTCPLKWDNYKNKNQK